MPLDQVQLNFNPQSLMILNAVLAVIMFGVALDMRFADFRLVFKAPRGPLVGLLAQFVVLPAGTYLLVRLVEPAPSIALGMILVASCPGGNVSNIMTHLARGSTALSVSMTALSTAAALVMTPFNTTFWGSLHPGTRQILRDFSLDPLAMFGTVALILGIPLILGLAISHYRPQIAARVRRPMRIISIVFFLAFVGGALAANWQNFMNYVGAVMFVVLVHNAFALGSGYAVARLWRLDSRDARAVSIETGIQNSGLGLILVFNFFDGLGGMAIIAAWWGIWHIIAGLGVALLWSRLDRRRATAATG